jgi:uncharacterized protein YkwD
VSTGVPEGALVERIDQERADRGQAALSRDDALAAAATAHTRGMVEQGSVTREGPDGESIGDRLAAADAGCDTHHAALFSTTVEDGTPAGLADGVVTAWLESADDRRAVLATNATRVGVDARFGDGNRLYVTAIAC